MSTNSSLRSPLTPEEIRWAEELANKLPGNVDLSFEEAKILTRLPIETWPKELLTKVRDVIDFEDFLNEPTEE